MFVGGLYTLFSLVCASMAEDLKPKQPMFQAGIEGADVGELMEPPMTSTNLSRHLLTSAMATSLALGLVLVVPASADPQTRGNLGGGFIEFLMTGQSGSVRHALPAHAPLPNPGIPVRASSSRMAPEVPAQYPVEVVSRLGDDPALQPSPYRQGSAAPYASAPHSSGFDEKFEKQEVASPGRHAPGTVIIDTPNRFLYLVQANGRALRYGIGVGRPGFEWAGVKSITMKREWPDWRPPAEMLKRRPDLPRHMVGGPDNPLGARALYLGSSLYRIHGTNEPETIGRAVSSGCIRMRNEDVTDLYTRVGVGTKVVVM